MVWHHLSERRRQELAVFTFRETVSGCQGRYLAYNGPAAGQIDLLGEYLEQLPSQEQANTIGSMLTVRYSWLETVPKITPHTSAGAVAATGRPPLEASQPDVFALPTANAPLSLVALAEDNRLRASIEQDAGTQTSIRAWVREPPAEFSRAHWPSNPNLWITMAHPTGDSLDQSLVIPLVLVTAWLTIGPNPHLFRPLSEVAVPIACEIYHAGPPTTGVFAALLEHRGQGSATTTEVTDGRPASPQITGWMTVQHTILAC
jgi:hypothetical protein